MCKRICSFALTYGNMSLSFAAVGTVKKIEPTVSQATSYEKRGPKSSNSPLRKHAYSIILKSLPPKKEKFQIKILRGGSNMYPQSKIMYTPVNPSFTI